MRPQSSKARQATRAVVIVAASALTLAACSGDGGGDGGGDGSGDGGPVEVEYWHRLPAVEGAKTVDDIVADFNSSQDDIHVTTSAFQGSEEDSYLQIASAVEAGNAACLAHIGYDGVPSLLSQGQLMDVTEYASQYEADYLDFAWARTTFEGATYGIPQDTAPMVYYYRADLFDEYGVEVPTTWEEFREAAEEIKEADPDARIAGFQADQTAWIMGLASANGALWWQIEDGGWTVDIDGQETMEVADYWQDLIDDDLVWMDLRWSPEFEQHLNDGTLVGTVGAAWEAPLIAGSAPDTAGEWAVAQTPDWPTSDFTGEYGGSMVGVLAGCDQPEASVVFANWLNTNTEALMPLGLLPATVEDSLDTPEDLVAFYGDQPIYDEFVTANDGINPDWSYSPTTSEVRTEFGDVMGRMTIGDATLPEAIEVAQETSVSSMTEAGITVNE